MDTIGLFVWASARREMFRVEILPIVRSVSPRQFWYLFVVGQLKGFRTAWRASLSARWARGDRRHVAATMTRIAWDVLCLRAGDIHLARDHCRSSHEERRRAAGDPSFEVAGWYPGQGETWGDPRQMLDRAAGMRKQEVWTHEDAPAELVSQAMRLLDRYDALAGGAPLPEDRELVDKGRRDAAEHEIHRQLCRLETRIKSEIESLRDLRRGVEGLNEHFARRSL